jgi:hypothetical protein
LCDIVDSVRLLTSAAFPATKGAGLEAALVVLDRSAAR